MLTATGIAAIVLGVVVTTLAGCLFAGANDDRDPAMTWEGRAALGFMLALVGGPFWIAQGVCTLLSGTPWLWAWWAAAPLVGLSSPVRAALAPVARRLERRSIDEVLQDALVKAWAPVAEPGWRPRLTAALPDRWPPDGDGTAVLFCYADRGAEGLVDAVEVSAPYARLTLGSKARSGLLCSSRKRSSLSAQALSERLQVFGPQGVRPLSSSDRVPASKAVTIGMIRRGDAVDAIADEVDSWRRLNGRIASHPDVVGHLPPATGR